MAGGRTHSRPPSTLSRVDGVEGTPDWVADAVFYQIFPDRFARSGRVDVGAVLDDWDAPPTFTGYKGGDLWGVIDRLDHLVDLGVTAIYFNPIFQSASNHRYHTHDYFRVDPLLGGDAVRSRLAVAAGGVERRPYALCGARSQQVLVGRCGRADEHQIGRAVGNVVDGSEHWLAEDLAGLTADREDAALVSRGQHVVQRHVAELSRM